MKSLRFAGLLCLFVSSALAAERTPEDVVSDLYTALGAGDEKRAVALISDSVQGTSGREVREDIRLHCIAVQTLRVAPAVMTGDVARVQAIAHVVRAPRFRGVASEDLERRQFELRRRNGTWAIEAMPLAEDLLVDRIVEEPKAGPALVAASSELIGPRLVARLIQKALSLALLADYPRPVRHLSDLAYDIAAAIDDRAGMAMALAAQLDDEQRIPATDKSRLLPKALRAMRIAEESGSPNAVAHAAFTLAACYIEDDLASREAERIYRRALQDRNSLTAGRLSQLLTGLGLVLFSREDYAAAYQVFTDCLSIAERDGLERGIVFNEVHLARILERQNDYELAAEHFRRATQFKGQKPFLIMAHLGIARANFMLGRQELALKEAKKALEVAQATPYKGLISRCFVLLAELKVADGEIAEAEKTLQDAVAYAREVKYPIAENEALLTLGNVYYRSRRYAEAIQAARDAEAVWGGTMQDADRYATSMLLARSEVALGNEERAIAHLNRAIEAVENIHEAVAGGERQQLLFFEPYYAAYGELARLLAGRGTAEDALMYAERGRGRVLLDSLGRAPSEADETLPPKDRDARAGLVRRLQNVNRRVIVLRSQQGVPRARLDEAIASQREAQLALDRFDSDLEARHPRLRSMRGKPATVTAPELRELVANRSFAILEYVVHEETTTLFVIRSDSSQIVESHRIAIPRAELQSRVEAYASQLKDQSLRYKKESRALYDLLVAPAAARLGDAQVVCVIPDGVLWKLPFESLVASDDRFLIERMAFFYAPSISAYRAILARRRQPDASRRVVAFGNPSIGEARERVAAVYRSADLGPLPDAEIEARTIAEVWGRGAAAYVKADAREDVAKREMSRARIVHFAAHGLFDDANPMYSQVVLAPHAAGSEDGALQAWELMRMDSSADLVVLSACETARGRTGAGEGLIGMSWALFVGGCPSTVAARWKIESAGTTQLMVEFHRALSRGSSGSAFPKADALRRAQLRLLRAKTTSHPFYWASFNLVGAP